MYEVELMNRISNGRTELIFEFLRRPDWREQLAVGPVKLLQWLVYYDDVTALLAVLEHGGDLSTIDLGEELGNAAFFGHWKTCEFLLARGADPNHRQPDTAETALHSALCKAGRPYYIHVVRLLLDAGADVNARTTPGRETGAFMRDVRTRGETPLHRAAAYADADTIRLLIERGADREARDAHGDSPLSWASLHLRPGEVLDLLCFGEHDIHPRRKRTMTSDHGMGWGNGMEQNFIGEPDT